MPENITINLLTICAIDINGKKPFMDAFVKVLETPSVPAHTGYWLNKIYKQCMEEYSMFEIVRDNLIKDLGQPIADEPGKLKIPTDKIPTFIEQIKSIDRSIKIDIPAGLKLKLPPVMTPADWFPIMTALDIFEMPTD